MRRLFEVDTICRLCLRIDEKVHLVNNTHHKAFIESIIRLKQSKYASTAELYVCYICSALLTKSFNFIQTVWSAQKIIGAILIDTNMVTKELVYLIDRDTTGLNPIILGLVETQCDSSSDTFDDEPIPETNEDTVLPTTSDIEKTIINVNTYIEDIDDNLHLSSFDDEPIPETNENTVLPTTSKDSTDIEKTIINVNTYIEDIDDNLHLSSFDDEPIPETNENTVLPTTSKDSTDIEKTIINVNTYIEDIDDNLHLSSFDDEPIPETNENTVLPTTSKDSTDIEKTIINVNKDIEDIDDNLQPDSTSHSEDSDHDSKDDERKPIKRSRDKRVYPMKCDHCDFELLEKRNHYRHYLFSHPNIEYPYKHQKTFACSMCGKLFTQQKISSHEASHTTQELKCFFCPKVFPDKKKRQRHLANVHPKNKLTCDYCDKIFKTRESIIRHIRTHTGSKPFKCHICGEGFGHCGYRSVHIRVKHQHLPSKKKAQKVHKSNKHRSTDAEISSNSEKTVRKSKIIRKKKNKSENTQVTRKKKK